MTVPIVSYQNFQNIFLELKQNNSITTSGINHIYFQDGICDTNTESHKDTHTIEVVTHENTVNDTKANPAYISTLYTPKSKISVPDIEIYEAIETLSTVAGPSCYRQGYKDRTIGN